MIIVNENWTQFYIGCGLKRYEEAVNRKCGIRPGCPDCEFDMCPRIVRQRVTVHLHLTGKDPDEQQRED